MTSPDTNADIYLTWKVNGKSETDEDFPQELLGENSSAYGTPVIVENRSGLNFSKNDSKFSRLILFQLQSND